MLLMGLRVEDGVDVARLEALRGRPLKADALAWLEEHALIARADGRLRLTARGRALANKIAAELAL
jgi:oxygen-independent coproporphyrinogen-3 oxidase